MMIFVTFPQPIRSTAFMRYLLPQKKLRYWIIGGLAATLFSSCSPADEATLAEPPKPAKLLTLTEATSKQRNNLPAIVRSVRSTNLAFQVGGQIVEWNAIDGEPIARGQIIARLDARSFQAAVERAEAEYKNARSEYERALRLIKEDAISRSVVEGREAAVQIAKASLDTARKGLSDTVLRAPFDGFVGRSNVEQFQNVAPQQTVLVLQSQAVEAIVNVPASFVLNSNRIRYFDAEVELDAAPGRSFSAVFREATGQADSSTQTFEAQFRFQPPSDLVVLTGMTATLNFSTEAVDEDVAASGVSVPLSAILTDGEQRFVWLVRRRGQAIEKRPVKVAEGIGDTLVVTDGLVAGDTIVAAGGSYFQEGEKVRPWDN